jgi:flagellar biosynthesis/type III secretory pathway protein FliH
MPAIVAAHRLSLAEANAASRAERELAQLRTAREGWQRGLAELNRVTAQVDVNLNSVLSELREATVELSLAVATKLLFQQVTSDTFPVDRLVADVLGRLNTHEPATVRLNPEDLASLQSSTGLPADSAREREVRLVADPRLSRGDCKAVSGEITVVYELRRQIDEIRRELLSAVSGHAEPGH